MEIRSSVQLEIEDNAQSRLFKETGKSDQTRLEKKICPAEEKRIMRSRKRSIKLGWTKTRPN
jgi:hypothetical protein